MGPLHYESGGEPQVWDPDQKKFVTGEIKVHIPCGHWHTPQGSGGGGNGGEDELEDLYVVGYVNRYGYEGETPDLYWVERRDVSTGDLIWQYTESDTQGIFLGGGQIAGADESGVYTNFSGTDSGTYSIRKLARDTGTVVWTADREFQQPCNPVIRDDYIYVSSFNGIPGSFSSIVKLNKNTGITVDTIASSVGWIISMAIDEDNGFLYTGGQASIYPRPYYMLEKRNLSDLSLIWSVNGSPLPPTYVSSSIYKILCDANGLFVRLYWYIQPNSHTSYQKRNEDDGSLIWDAELSLTTDVSGWAATQPWGGSLNSDNLYYINKVIDRSTQDILTWTIPQASLVFYQDSTNDGIIVGGQGQAINCIKVNKSDYSVAWSIDAGVRRADNTCGVVVVMAYYKN
jgi:hypothetical protein